MRQLVPERAAVIKRVLGEIADVADEIVAEPAFRGELPNAHGAKGADPGHSPGSAHQGNIRGHGGGKCFLSPQHVDTQPDDAHSQLLPPIRVISRLASGEPRAGMAWVSCVGALLGSTNCSSHCRCARLFPWEGGPVGA